MDWYANPYVLVYFARKIPSVLRACEKDRCGRSFRVMMKYIIREV